ncbi:MAG: sigma-70 family RNA polymerase sigma factor [Planctomycetales bacterium]|nr:sigma-70 family RNA polymerase sigma factor [Planctomycetales bacterium]
MDTPPNDRLVQLVQAAQDGCPDALGEITRACRPYLLAIANGELGDKLRGKMGASDIVQDTLLQACCDIKDFQGRTQHAFLAWLRGILLHEIADAHRLYRDTEKRDINREQSISRNTSKSRDSEAFASPRLTPCSESIAREEAMIVRSALSRMPAHFVDVIRLRNWQQKSWNEVGIRMGRSAEAARKLWSRAIERLREELENDGNST